MSQKYTDARYPEKINDLIDNEGGLSEEGKKAIEESGVEAKDPRIPEITPEDVGKMISVDAEGNLVLVEAPAGGTKFYKHECRFVASSNECIVVLFNNYPNEMTHAQVLQSLRYAN